MLSKEEGFLLNRPVLVLTPVPPVPVLPQACPGRFPAPNTLGVQFEPGLALGRGAVGKTIKPWSAG